LKIPSVDGKTAILGDRDDAWIESRLLARWLKILALEGLHLVSPDAIEARYESIYQAVKSTEWFSTFLTILQEAARDERFTHPSCYQDAGLSRHTAFQRLQDEGCLDRIKILLCELGFYGSREQARDNIQVLISKACEHGHITAEQVRVLSRQLILWSPDADIP